jgi:ATP-dependent DNA helicase DinG
MLTGGRSTLGIPPMRAFFGPGGRLAASLPGFEPREGQAALAQEVADALERGEHLLAEAGTGRASPT